MSDKMKNTRILVVVDESPATTKALRYVAQMAAGRPNFRICLAHSLPPQPRQLMEIRGAEKGRLRAYRSRWISADDKTEQRALDRANEVLMKGGIEAGAIKAHYCYLVDGTRATRDILALALAQKCDTVVIGRRSLSWLGNLINTDPAEELVRGGKGFTIWVVE
ncbi:MAG: universal stress protein [Candidatus Acidiferrales bacterium]